MSNMQITNIDIGSVVIKDALYRDGHLAFAAGGTMKEGTILGRRHTVADEYTGVITGTGTRVAVLKALPGGHLKAGVYTLLAGTLASGVGAWTLTDPRGAAAQFTSASAGGDLFFPALGVWVEIADTGTNYATGDSVAFTAVAASGFRAFDPDGSNGADVAAAVLTYNATRETAGNLPARALVSGVVNENRLLIHADGDGDDITEAHLDQLRSVGIVPIRTNQLARLDNQ